MRKYLALFLIITVMVCVISCSNDDALQMGTLNVEIDSSVARGIQAISMETASYNVTIKNSSGELVFNSSSSMNTSYSFSVPIGTYTIEVEALNEDGIVIGTGSTTGFVSAGQTNAFTVTVSEPSGNGTFSISIIANEGYELSYSIKDASGQAIKEGALDFSNGKYSASAELSNGFYSFSIKRNDTNKVLKSDTVRIIKGRTVSYEAEFLILSDGSIVIENSIVQNPSVSLSLNSKYLETGDTLEVSANISGIDNYTCYWSLDGVAQSEAKEYEDFSYIIAASDTGEHEIALFVTNGTVIWSKSETFSANTHPTSVTVAGDIEIFVIGNVLIPRDLKILVSIGDVIGTNIDASYHKAFKNEPEGTVISVSEVDVDGYYVFIETENDADNNQTIVYFVIDKDIENPAYITLQSNLELHLEENEYQLLLISHSEGNSGIDEIYVLTNDRSDRQIKVEPNIEYSFEGQIYSNSGRFINSSIHRFEVDAGENLTISLTRSPYGTISATAPAKYDIYEVYNDDLYREGVIRKGEVFAFEELKDEYYCKSFIPTYGTDDVTSYYTASGTTSEGNNVIELEEVMLEFNDCGCSVSGDGFDIAYDTRAVVPEYSMSFLMIGSKVFNMRLFNNGHMGYQFENEALSIATGPGFERYKLSANCENDTITLIYDLPDDEYATLNLVYDFDYDESYYGACPIVWMDDVKYVLDLSGKPSSIKVKPGTYGSGGSVRFSRGSGTEWVFVCNGFTVAAGETQTLHLKNHLN